MAFRLALAQCVHPADGNVVALVERFARQARSQHADMVAFPECLMTPHEKEPAEFARAAEPLDGPFGQAMSRITRECGLWIVYTANERAEHGGAQGAKTVEDATYVGAQAVEAAETRDPARAEREGGQGDPRPYNTAVIVDDAGARRGVYRKAHLFDAGAHRESAKMRPGSALFEPIDTPFGKLGLGICYDLRFPEAARAAALGGCEVLILPAAWVDGSRKAEQWRTLLAARAVENEMFVAGVCRPDAGCIGESRVVGPNGRVIAQAPAARETLVVADIDLADLRAARASIPVLEHRRPELYA